MFYYIDVMALVHPTGYSRESSESRLLPLDNEVQDPLGDLFDFDQIMATEPLAPDQDMSSAFAFGDGAPLFNTNDTLDYLHTAANDVAFPPSTHFDYLSMFPSLDTALPGAAAAVSAVSAASALRGGCDPTLSQAAAEKPLELAHEHPLLQSAAAPALSAAASGLPATPPLTPSTRMRKKQERTTPASASTNTSPTTARSLRWKPSTSGPRVSRKRAGSAKRKTESPSPADRSTHKAKVNPPTTAPVNQQNAMYAAAAAAAASATAAASTPTVPPRFGLLGGNGFAPLSPPPSGRAPSGGFPATSPLLGVGGMMPHGSLIGVPMSSPSDGTFRSPDMPEVAAFSPNFFTEALPGGSQPSWPSPGPTMGGVFDGQPLNMSNGFSATAALLGTTTGSHRAGPALVGHETPATQAHGWWHLDGVNQSFTQPSVQWSEQRDATRMQEASQRMMEMMSLSSPDVANFATSGLMISCADDDMQNPTSTAAKTTTTTTTAMGNGFGDSYDLISPTAPASGFVLPTALAAAAHMPSSPPSTVPPRTPSPLSQQQQLQQQQGQQSLPVPRGSAVGDNLNGDHTATTATTTSSPVARGRRPRKASARSPRRPTGRPPGRPRGSRASQQTPAASADQGDRLGVAGVPVDATTTSSNAQLPPAAGQIPLPMPGLFSPLGAPLFDAHHHHQHQLLSSPSTHALLSIPNSTVPYLSSTSSLQLSQAPANHDAAVAAVAAAAATATAATAAAPLLPGIAPYNAVGATEPPTITTVAAAAQNPANNGTTNARQAHHAINSPSNPNNNNNNIRTRRNRSSHGPLPHHGRGHDNTTPATLSHHLNPPNNAKHSNGISRRREGSSSGRAGGGGGGGGGGGKGRGAGAGVGAGAGAGDGGEAGARGGKGAGAAAAKAAALDFVNFTPHDHSVILSAVAPSGSSKTKARREKEAAERRRKLSAAAVRAVQAAGGDPDPQRSQSTPPIT